MNGKVNDSSGRPWRAEKGARELVDVLLALAQRRQAARCTR